MPTGVYDRKLSKERKTNQRLDITGQRFGRLVAVAPGKKYEKEYEDNKSSTYYWLFKCDCGEEKEILVASVTRKSHPTRSCGCLKRVRTEHLGSQEKVNFIRSGLRNLWLKWPPRYHVKAAAKVAYGIYLCEGYERDSHEVRAKEVQIDHREPVGELTDWDTMIEKLFCPASNLQVLCKECHTKKTAIERSLAAEARNIKKEETNEIQSI